MNCQRCCDPLSFFSHVFTMFIWNRVLATVSRTFCRPHRPKVVWDRQFFAICIWNRALVTVSCTFCRPLSWIEPRDRGNRDPPAATSDGHFTWKNTRFCARECFQAWIHTFPLACTSQLLHDDVIDMMIWLTWWLRWWCGCHDGETSSHWQSSVTRKFPN